MKIAIDKGELRIDVYELVKSLGPKEARQIAMHLACDEVLWKAVLECVSDESKYGGHFFKDDEEGYWWFDRRTVLQLREKLIPLMPEIARLTAEETLRQRDESMELERHTRKWAWDMYHAWPSDRVRSRPELPPLRHEEIG